jgi:hypothetical protein
MDSVTIEGHHRRPIRIGNCSGAIGDGIDQLYRQAAGGPIDAITADYLAEFNIAWKAIEVNSFQKTGWMYMKTLLNIASRCRKIRILATNQGFFNNWHMKMVLPRT